MARPRQRPRSRNNGNGNGSDQGNSSAIYDRARRDVMLSLHPYLQSLKRARRQAGRDTRQTNQRVQDVYGALGSQLGALNQPYQDTMAGIGNNLSAQTAGLSPLLQQSIGQAAPGEAGAAGGLIGVIGSGGLNQLGTMAGVNAGYNTSAQRQGAEESAITQRNALSDLANFRSDKRNQVQDIMQQAAPQTLQRMDQLQQQGLDRRLALANLAMQQGQYGMQQAQFATDQAAQAAQQSIWNQLMQNPNILQLLFGGP